MHSYDLKWDVKVTTFYSGYAKDLHATPTIRTFAKSKVIEKMLESILLNYCGGIGVGRREVDDIRQIAYDCKCDIAYM